MPGPPLAHIAIGELSGLVVAVGTILGYLWRTSRRMLDAAERNLQAIADNAAVNRQLAQALVAMQQTVQNNTARLERLEAIQRSVRAKVQDVQVKVSNGG